MLPLTIKQLKTVSIIFISLFSFNSYAQQSSVWGSVDDIQTLKKSKTFEQPCKRFRYLSSKSCIA